MAEIKPGSLPSKPVKEKREDALARLLFMACSLLPEPSALGINEDDASDMLSEAHFWLYGVPAGDKAPPSSPELRLGGRAYGVALQAELSKRGLAPPPNAPPKK